MPKRKPDQWRAVVGDAPELLHHGNRAYFPYVVMPCYGRRGDEKVIVHSGSGPMAEADRRACLIAAAPDMLTALKRCVNAIDEELNADGGDELIRRHAATAAQARTAIAKAEGK